ncbi:hypothetical protein IPL68_01615 [Candidatus Saccharibacteria bacterium]|nr:MAG: hypothetical protein IPL68_01615 [Candidatus Saccharibacteria bacterium]
MPKSLSAVESLYRTEQSLYRQLWQSPATWVQNLAPKVFVLEVGFTVSAGKLASVFDWEDGSVGGTILSCLAVVFTALSGAFAVRLPSTNPNINAQLATNTY